MKPLPFTRRQMLMTTAAGSAPFFWSRRLLGAEDLKPLSFVVVSDTHLGRKDNEQAEEIGRAHV